MKKHIFIIGSKGIPASYGGYETFVDKLTEYRKDKNIQYHVSCAVDKLEESFTYNDAHCFNIRWKKIGPARAIIYDGDAFRYCLKYIKKHKIQNAIIYVLDCRMGLVFHRCVEKARKLGVKVYVNPDGHEWLRGKWSRPVRQYWKASERLMIKEADLVICDSKNIEKYIQEMYKEYCPKTTFIAYGAETSKSELRDDDTMLLNWYRENGLRAGKYYLVVGRFVPENNYETMIREFMQSKTKKDFALITNVSDKFLNELKEKTRFDKDPRIKFVGTVYDQELLKKIRENAYGYFHGHEVGGTNPSLLEALGSTRLNLLLDVGFNREVAEDGALYWTKEEGKLSKLIEEADELEKDAIVALGDKAKERIRKWYSWEYITAEYEKIFSKCKR